MLKLTLKIGDIAQLTAPGIQDAAGAPIDIILDRTRKTGARLLVRDDQGNGVDAWLEIGDTIHLEGYFGKPARIELASRSGKQAKLIFDVPDHVRIDRITTSEQCGAAGESEVA